MKAVFGRNVALGPGGMYPDSWLSKDFPEIASKFCEVKGLPCMEVLRVGFAFDAGWSDRDKEVREILYYKSTII